MQGPGTTTAIWSDRPVHHARVRWRPDTGSGTDKPTRALPNRLERARDDLRAFRSSRFHGGEVRCSTSARLRRRGATSCPRPGNLPRCCARATRSAFVRRARSCLRSQPRRDDRRHRGGHRMAARIAAISVRRACPGTCSRDAVRLPSQTMHRNLRRSARRNRRNPVRVEFAHYHAVTGPPARFNRRRKPRD
ncbi:hypothetical protein GALL_291930 [mine drainage metagenome]|uniref:Uncharacterized protein n=1 Tax=mine drainage metagenome TaxID=410659 RepID=A0A1J5RH30_9ZZZZ